MKTYDEESKEICQTEEIKEDDLESEKSETDKRDQTENLEWLKMINSQKKERMAILLIPILICRKMWLKTQN